MTPRIRTSLFAILGITLFISLSAISHAQRGGGGGGGGGGRGPQADPTQVYIKQMELEGKTKNAFVKAYRNHVRKLSKWQSNVRTFQNKNRKYVGQSDVAPEVIEKIKADKADLDAQKKQIDEEFQASLAVFFTPEQIEQVGQIGKRIAEQRARARERRAAGGGGGRGGGGGGGAR